MCLSLSLHSSSPLPPLGPHYGVGCKLPPPQKRLDQVCALAKVGVKTWRWGRFKIYCLYIVRGWEGDIQHIIFQRNKVSQGILGPDALLPCCNSFLWGAKQFHFLPELSTVNWNNSALCHPDSLVKPTEQNVTNRIPGKRGVAHRLKLTTSPHVANLHLSHRKNSEAKPNPWAKFNILGKRRGENKHLKSIAAVSNSPSRLQSWQRLCS